MVSFHGLSVLRVGTVHKKKTSCGLVASAKRCRTMRAGGKNRMAMFSSIKCSVSRF
jgi:hypothetical protein